MELPKETLEEMVGLVKAIRTSKQPRGLRDEYLKRERDLRREGYDLTPLYEALREGVYTP